MSSFFSFPFDRLITFVSSVLVLLFYYLGASLKVPVNCKGFIFLSSVILSCLGAALLAGTLYDILIHQATLDPGPTTRNVDGVHSDMANNIMDGDVNSETTETTSLLGATRKNTGQCKRNTLFNVRQIHCKTLYVQCMTYPLFNDRQIHCNLQNIVCSIKGKSIARHCMLNVRLIQMLQCMFNVRQIYCKTLYVQCLTN